MILLLIMLIISITAMVKPMSIARMVKKINQDFYNRKPSPKDNLSFIDRMLFRPDESTSYLAITRIVGAITSILIIISIIAEIRQLNAGA